ncbi:IS1096 element passenger TnpR family protein [Rubrolithibacter danxiaensis]|uniref:IS1096 element passenger TnpR family protein n=1 Tax=Rubrolithibacter danxiaensis TaxID=3390805 RepID=UPI003BF900F4
MAIYRFRVSFEDYDDVIREIDIRSTQTFEDLHYAIHRTTGYNAEQSSSFYVSNDHWIKNEEIAFLPTQRKIDRGVTIMSNTKLSRFIDDPHQKFYYTYNFDRPYDFHVELIKILEEEKGKEYPTIIKTVGEAPKPLGAIQAPPNSGEEEDFDFLNEMDVEPEDTEDFETVDDLGIEVPDVEDQEEDEDKDEFMDEFNDNEHADSEDDYHKDDY